MPLDCEESVGHSCGCPFGLSSETGLLVTTSFSGSDRMDNVLKDHRHPSCLYRRENQKRGWQLFFYRLYVQALPQIPACNRAIRSPGLCDFLHHGRLGPLAFLVMLLDGSLHAVIANRQNIRTPQGEHQKHVRRPDADAFDLSEM